MNVKKIIAFVCGAVVCLPAILAENKDFSVEFSNEISTDVVNVTVDKTVFTGLTNEITADFTSEKVDAGIKAVLQLSVDSAGGGRIAEF